MSNNARKQKVRNPRSGIAFAMLMSRYGGFMHDRRSPRGGSMNMQKIFLQELEDAQTHDEIEECIDSLLNKK